MTKKEEVNKNINCLNCLWYDSMTYDDYVEVVDDYLYFTEHWCHAHGGEKMDWEEIEEMTECPDYMKRE